MHILNQEVEALKEELELNIDKRNNFAKVLITTYDEEKKFWLQQNIKQLECEIENLRQEITSLEIKNDKISLNRKKIPSGGKKVFFSYSQHDRSFLIDFQKHLSALVRQGKLQLWDDTKILPGEEWDKIIKQELANADIILLLVSNNFFATDYIWKVEITHALERHKCKEAIVIPIILSPCDWTSSCFSHLNALPLKGNPITTYSNHHIAWMEVVKGIHSIL